MIDSSFKFAGIAGAMALAISASVVAQDAEQWRVEDGGNGHWYGVRDTAAQLSWSNASALAMAEGGHLATVLSLEEAEITAQVGSDPSLYPIPQVGPWIGGLLEDGEWRWETGEPLRFENWYPPNPDTPPTENRICITNFPGSEGTWNDFPESGFAIAFITTSFIIEFSADCNGDGIVDYGQIRDGTFADTDGDGVPDCCDDAACLAAVQWTEAEGGNGHWYTVNLDSLTWSESTKVAEAMGAHLATLKTPEENQFMFDLARSRTSDLAITFGLIQAVDSDEPDGGWSWVDGSPLKWANWAAGEPNDTDGIEDEGNMYLDPDLAGGWNDGRTTSAEASAVEWSADCNGDGIVDYGQIRDGTFADTDGNGVPDVCEVCLGDITGNGVVDAADLGILLAVWNTDGKSNPEADINGDGTVNAADLGILLGAWGPCP